MLEASSGVATTFMGGSYMTHSTPHSSALKTCTKCGETKPLTEFYMIHSGIRAGRYHARCRKCQSVHEARYRAKNKERIREKDRRYHQGNRQRAAERTRKWRDQNREKRREISSRYAAKHGDRRLAHGAVNDAVRRGNFPPAWTMVCEYCQEAQAAHWHHHKGYDREVALDVVAVCKDCHTEAHRSKGYPEMELTNGRTLLTKEQVREIRQRAANGELATAIAQYYGVARTTVHSIIHGRTWRNI